MARIGRGDSGGLALAVPATVAERGGSTGRDDVGGGHDVLSRGVMGADGVCGESTVIEGVRGDNDTVLRPSCRGVANNCGDLGGARPGVRSGGSIRGFGFSLGGGCGDDVLIGGPSATRQSIHQSLYRQYLHGVSFRLRFVAFHLTEISQLFGWFESDLLVHS